MEFGVAIILVILLFVAYVVVQETRAQLFWRKLVDEGDIDAIRQLIEAEVETWHSARVPRGVPALLWHGIQTVELLDVSGNACRVSCSADGESALIGGRRVETSSPLAEGMKITQKLAEMLLYDIPNVKLDHVQIDVYTSFRDDAGRAESRCVLSTRVERAVVEHIDWEQMEPGEFIDLCQGHFASDLTGRLQGVEPLAWTDGAAKGS
jgi:hypothetical protein